MGPRKISLCGKIEPKEADEGVKIKNMDISSVINCTLNENSLNSRTSKHTKLIQTKNITDLSYHSNMVYIPNSNHSKAIASSISS
jgi:hypothetical protein